MAARGILAAIAGGLALLALTACDPVAPGRTPGPPPLPAVDLPRGAESEALSVYYQQMQNDLVARGLLRTDGGGVDTPFTDAMLARNFVRIALFDEYVSEGQTLRAQTTISHLRRWEQPIRMSVEFGPTIPAAQRPEDAANVANFAVRLSRLTGVPISQTSANANFHVLVLNEGDRRGYAARLRALVPGISESSVRAFTDLPRSQLCIVVAFSDGPAQGYSQAVAVIRGEHPDLLRLSCIHEELAQGMGLANDSPQARPSIFNDDEEFGLLTTQDEYLLRMLYDPRFRVGMTADTAAPIARQIAFELLSGAV